MRRLGTVETAASATAMARTVAVLPLRRLNAQAGEEYLGVGIADALITSLSNVRQLIVRPTVSVMRYDKPDQDPLAAGREQKAGSGGWLKFLRSRSLIA